MAAHVLHQQLDELFSDALVARYTLILCGERAAEEACTRRHETMQ
jgi:hypothetical protein